LSEISGTNFAQGSVLNYVYYRASTNSSDFRFRLNYTFDGALSIRVGAYDLYEMASGDYYTLTVDQLFATLDESGKANVSVILPDGTEFIFPFTFKNTYTTTPSVSSVTIDSVTFLDANLASLSFSYTYSQAEKILYEVKNQNGDTINSSTVNVQYSASSASETVTVDSLSVSNASSITVSVTASSLSATSGIETIKSSTLSTSSYSFPLRLSLEDPASIKFYNDLSLTSVADKLKRGQKLYAKLQLKDINGSIINTVDYPKYIQVDPTSLTFSIAGFLDVNEEVNGVIFSKETDYVYSIILSADSSFSENEITVNANYIPLYQL